MSPAKFSHPYYIYAPPYTEASAGIRALHMLADGINRAGGRAYVASEIYVAHLSPAPSHLDAPVLTWAEAQAHRREGLKPIVVYPEVVDGNPLRSQAVVRWVLNLPGLLGGPSIYEDSEFVYGYGKRLAQEIGHPERALFLPAIDLDDWPPQHDQERTEICFYASKYRAVHGGEVFGVPEGAIEITRSLSDSIDREDLKALLGRSKRLYVFENTALAIEAPLCGCPVVMMPNPHLGYPIGDLDHGMAGIAWGDDPAEISRAETTVDQMRAGYQATIDRFPHDLLDFIARTQAYRETVSGYAADCRILKDASYEADAARYTRSILAAGQGGLSAAVVKSLGVVRQRGLLSSLKIGLNLVRALLVDWVASWRQKAR
jgi:hypothetical protein